MYDYFVFQSVFFHDFFLFHLLFSLLLSPSPLFFSFSFFLVLSLLLHVSFSSFVFLLLFSLLLSPSTLFFFFFFFSLSSSLFSLCLLSPCVGGVCVVVCVVVCVWCVWCGVWCTVWCGTLKTPCVDSKRFPCVDSTRPRVCRQHAHMLKHVCACCRHTRGRFESTHGKRF